MSTLLDLLGLAVLVVAVVALVRGRLGWARIASRKTAVAVLVGSFVLLGTGGALAAPSTVTRSTASPVLPTVSGLPSTTATTVPAVTTVPTTTSAPPSTTTPPVVVTTTRVTTLAPPPPAPPVTTKRATTVAPPPPPQHVIHTVPVAALICVASMSDAQPVDNSTTDVDVRTAAGATVTATAHYKTTITSHTAVAASDGGAEIDFRISRATVGYRVTVDVTVAAGGASMACSTSFTPQGN